MPGVPLAQRVTFQTPEAKSCMHLHRPVSRTRPSCETLASASSFCMQSTISIRRLLLFGGSLSLLLGVVGCFTQRTEIGAAQRVGNFSIQKFHLVRLNDTGNTESDFFEISHGRYWRTKLGLPPENWTSFDRVARLPSDSVAWLVEEGAWSGLITERDGNPRVETLWRGDYDNPIQQISATQWHIPDYARIARAPEEMYSGGRIFDAHTLTQRQLPDQPLDHPGRFLGLSPDATAVAWLSVARSDEQTLIYSVLASDDRGATSQGLVLTKELLHLSVPPNGTSDGPSRQKWFEGSFAWRRNGLNRWEAILKRE